MKKTASKELIKYLKEVFGYSTVEEVDPITAEAILANISPDNPPEEQVLDLEFRDLYLKHHGLKAKMTCQRFAKTKHYRMASYANAYGRKAS